MTSRPKNISVAVRVTNLEIASRHVYITSSQRLATHNASAADRPKRAREVLREARRALVDIEGQLRHLESLPEADGGAVLKAMREARVVVDTIAQHPDLRAFANIELRRMGYEAGFERMPELFDALIRDYTRPSTGFDVEDSIDDLTRFLDLVEAAFSDIRLAGYESVRALLETLRKRGAQYARYVDEDAYKMFAGRRRARDLRGNAHLPVLEEVLSLRRAIDEWIHGFPQDRRAAVEGLWRRIDALEVSLDAAGLRVPEMMGLVRRIAATLDPNPETYARALLRVYADSVNDLEVALGEIDRSWWSWRSHRVIRFFNRTP